MLTRDPLAMLALLMRDPLALLAVQRTRMPALAVLVSALALVAGLAPAAADPPLPRAAPEATPHSPARPVGGRAVDGFYADPTIAVHDRTYYLYPTTDGEAYKDASFTVWTSTDLATWRKRGEVLRLGPDVAWADKLAWAPEIAERDGRWYLYFTGDMKIGVAVADSPLGPFRDSGRPLVSENPGGRGQAIDPAVLAAPDGTRWLYWGNGQAHVVPLNPDMVSFDPKKVTVIRGLDGFGEGLHMAYRAGTYHLTWSIGHFTSEDYRVGYATAPSPTGPFTNHGVILAKDLDQGVRGPGHGSMLRIPGTDEWYYAYHRFAIPGGDGTHREVTLDRVPITPEGRFGRIAPTLAGPAPRPVPLT
ncbi:family 43 glycosylhydrolase [Pseudonocardia sp. C8]|uniref:family 43 glycosylhydrolase n=1 Tax=Pseudonocardia sp. C8 TaxID=2762759 RepID=UPI00351C8722